MMSKRGWELWEEEDLRFWILDLKDDVGFPEVEATGVLRGGAESHLPQSLKANSYPLGAERQRQGREVSTRGTSRHRRANENQR